MKGKYIVLIMVVATILAMGLAVYLLDVYTS